MGIKLDKDYYDDKSLSLTYPLNNSRIGYLSEVTEDNISASSVAGFPARSMGNPFTYDLWKPPVSPAVITVDLGKVKSIDYIGIGAHKLGGCQVTVSVSRDAIDYTEVRTAIVLEDRALMLLFDSVDTRYVQVLISGWAIDPTLSLDFVNQEYTLGDYTDASDIHVGVLFAGQSMAMQRPHFGGVTPTLFAKQTEIRPNVSEGGQWLGRSKVRRGYNATYSWKHLRSDWMRTTFKPFIDYATEGEGAFFISWRPGQYANETLYAWVDSSINPSNMGVLDYMQVDLPVKGHGDE